jgi:hypothetical protein
MITHSETVILMEPPRNEAAPSKAYLITDHTALCQDLLKEYKYWVSQKDLSWAVQVHIDFWNNLKLSLADELEPGNSEVVHLSYVEIKIWYANFQITNTERI